jgi:hypothetical protein
MMNDAELETRPESRLSAFQGGAGMPGAQRLNTATSIQENVEPKFSPVSILQLANVIPNANGMSLDTYRQRMPQDAMMRSMAGLQP